MELPLEQTCNRRLWRKPRTIEKKQEGDRDVRRRCRNGRTLAADRKNCRERDHYHHEPDVGIEQSQDFFHSNAVGDMRAIVKRSEEHTSELQSLMRISYAVFCLKKKNKNNSRETNHCTKITPQIN